MIGFEMPPVDRFGRDISVDTSAGEWWARNAACWQGTVGPWLIKPFIEAHSGVQCGAGRAAEFLTPVVDQLRIERLGTVGKIFEGGPPKAQRGFLIQAWSVGDILRAWRPFDRHTAE
jgi:hypothetical protein